MVFWVNSILGEWYFGRKVFWSNCLETLMIRQEEHDPISSTKYISSTKNIVTKFDGHPTLIQGVITKI